MVLADWSAVGDGGKELASGTSVFSLVADGRIDSVTSVRNEPA
jgi:hypothetical protein